MQDDENFNAKPAYIFASCKSWHRASFDQISTAANANWFYVSNISELEDTLSKINPRYIFFLHWSWIVPEAIWKEYECVCFHMTDVPYGRGGSPLQNLILAGHTQTMLSALRMVKEMDAGPVYAKRPLSLDGPAEEIYLRAGKLSIEIIQWITEHNPQPTPQEGDVVTFKRRKPEQSGLPTAGNLKNAYDFIRMLDADGYPNAFIEHGEYRIHFRNARLGRDRVIAEVEIKIQNKPDRVQE
jgi:methionyl-tRNA formyltransferase